MYQVFCRSPRKGMRWQEYSRPFQTKEAAEAVKKTAEERRLVDLYDSKDEAIAYLSGRYADCKFKEVLYGKSHT